MPPWINDGLPIKLCWLYWSYRTTLGAGVPAIGVDVGVPAIVVAVLVTTEVAVTLTTEVAVTVPVTTAVGVVVPPTAVQPGNLKLPTRVCQVPELVAP